MSIEWIKETVLYSRKTSDDVIHESIAINPCVPTFETLPAGFEVTAYTYDTPLLQATMPSKQVVIATMGNEQEFYHLWRKLLEQQKALLALWVNHSENSPKFASLEQDFINNFYNLFGVYPQDFTAVSYQAKEG